MGLFGIILSLGLLMYLAYRGITVLILAPLLALLALMLNGEFTLLGTYTQVFMKALGDYVIKYFPLFMLGAIFGKLMADSGSARTIAETIVEKLGPTNAIAAIVLSCGILTYGGVSLFVVAFAVYPIAAAMFRRADIPKRLIPAAIALGSFTFTMTAFPGTPAIQNAIPMPYFGTTPFAAPIVGIAAGLVMLIGGVAWLNFRARRAAAASEGYGEHEESAIGQAAEIEGQLPAFSVAMAPAVAVIGLNALFTYVVIPMMDTGYLQSERFGNASIADLRGIWAIIAALVLSILLLVALNFRRLTDLKTSLNKGTVGSLLPVFNTASEVGYGAIIASLPAFFVVRDAVLGLTDNPLINVAVATNVLAGITGSASGGMSIALEALGTRFAEMAQQAGISEQLMHRITTLSSGGFDALPHNGAVITLLGICGLTHRQSYGDIFVVAVAIPVFATMVAIALGTMGIV